jgi:tripartite-type tricarboxylate transporter receptor subunit TctC
MNIRMMLAAIVAVLFGSVSFAQPYPTKLIRFVVPYAPGGDTDQIARRLGAKMSESVGQQVLVDNRPGASTTLGTDIVAKAAPDGHTVLITNEMFVITAAIHPKLPYDPIRDFAPISILARAHLLLVSHPNLSAKSAKDLAGLRDRDLMCATGGQATISHFACELWKDAHKARLVSVLYKGTAPALTDIIGGTATMGFFSTASARPYVSAGKLRAYAVTTERRSAALPEVPTLFELGMPQLDLYPWWAALAPARTPSEIISRLNKEFVRALGDKIVTEALAQNGIETWGSSPGEAADFIKKEIEKYTRLVKVTGIKAP